MAWRNTYAAFFASKSSHMISPLAAGGGNAPQPPKNEIPGYFPVMGLIPGSASGKFPVRGNRETFVTD
jgi:hypothetical protein